MTFTVPYVGVVIYIIYIVGFGYTRFHIVRHPEAEEIKRKWEEDAEFAKNREREEKSERNSGKGPEDPPYRKV